MKQHIPDFVRRGLSALGLGPLVLAVLYLFLHRQGILDTLTVEQVCTGIFSLSALAFLAGGMNVLYQIERLPLMAAISTALATPPASLTAPGVGVPPKGRSWMTQLG